MDGLVEEYEAADAAQRGLKFHVLEEGDDETCQADWAQNREDADLLTRRYRISNSLMDDPLRNQEGKRKEPMPVNNVLSGAGVIMRYGEGILDFVYADFKTPAVETMEYLRAWGSLRRAYRKENPTVSEDALPEKVYDQTQEIEEDYYRYLDTLPLTKIMGMV